MVYLPTILIEKIITTQYQENNNEKLIKEQIFKFNKWMYFNHYFLKKFISNNQLIDIITRTNQWYVDNHNDNLLIQINIVRNDVQILYDNRNYSYLLKWKFNNILKSILNEKILAKKIQVLSHKLNHFYDVLDDELKIKYIYFHINCKKYKNINNFDMIINLKVQDEINNILKSIERENIRIYNLLNNKREKLFCKYFIHKQNIKNKRKIKKYINPDKSF